MLSKRAFFTLLLVLLIGLHLATLVTYPLMHSDEAWLAGLGAHMDQVKSIGVTEPFFDLYPRYPHAIKLTYQLVVILFQNLLGVSLFSIRLLSLVFGLASLYFFYAYMARENKVLAAVIALAYMASHFFFYSSHFGRQESMLLFFLALGLWYSQKEQASPYWAGLLITLSIGVHPNSFLVFLPVLVSWLHKSMKKSLLLIATTGLGALSYIGFSFLLDQKFIRHYLSYGESLGVKMTLLDKLEQVLPFYQKLYYQVSGTYVLPDSRFLLLFFAGLVLLSLFLVKERRIRLSLLMITAFHAGLIFIGRYNQMNMAFIGFLGFLLLFELLNILPKKAGKTLLVVGLMITILSTGKALLMSPKQSYEDFWKDLTALHLEGPMLGNLNMYFAYPQETFYDYRNLGYLRAQGLTIRQYLEERHIKTILINADLAFIYNTRPRWNGLYGNTYPYYEELMEILKEDYQLVAHLSSPTYGQRLAYRIDQEEYPVLIYQKKP